MTTPEPRPLPRVRVRPPERNPNHQYWQDQAKAVFCQLYERIGNDAFYAWSTKMYASVWPIMPSARMRLEWMQAKLAELDAETKEPQP